MTILRGLDVISADIAIAAVGAGRDIAARRDAHAHISGGHDSDMPFWRLSAVDYRYFAPMAKSGLIRRAGTIE